MSAPLRLHGRVILVAGLVCEADLALPIWLQSLGARVAVGGLGQGLLWAAQQAGLLALTLPPGDGRAAEIGLAAVLDGLGGLHALLHLPVRLDAEGGPRALEAALLRSAAGVACIEAALPAEIAENVLLVHLYDGGASPAQAAVDGARRGWSEARARGGAGRCLLLAAPGGYLDPAARARLLEGLGAEGPRQGLRAALRRRLRRLGARLQPPQTTSAAS